MATTVPIKWSSPMGKIDVVKESNSGYKINFQFHCALPVVLLLAEGVEDIIFSIKPATASTSYSYFDGSISQMESDIDDYFTSVMAHSEEHAEYGGEYYSFYYSRISLLNYLPDAVISDISKISGEVEIVDEF